MAATSNGSSPLARGTHEETKDVNAGLRFIPARAGNTRTGPRPTRRLSVHPRSRGEHWDGDRKWADQSGSSPLARGTRQNDARAKQSLRFIPARAGNTGCWSIPPTAGPVHPRSRGEHTLTPTSVAPDAGSSPLARGTRGHGPRDRPERRFIPARAGNTRRVRRRGALEPVHPRSRGEHDREQTRLPHHSGSSPLARGTHRPASLAKEEIRFIPARAGNTPTDGQSTPGRPVHPRSRGEHRSMPGTLAASSGSSPLARGTHRLHPPGEPGRRFIPARAGNTCLSRVWRFSATVHPRSRGEHLPPVRIMQSETGSSPLARGTLRPAFLAGNCQRFIPARAGNTPCAPARWTTGTVHPRSRGEHLCGRHVAYH